MGAHGVTIGSDGRHVFVTNTKDSTVSVIDTASQTVVDTIPVGKEPGGIAFADGT
jgi:YVTN family beta-propeller protein